MNKLKLSVLMMSLVGLSFLFSCSEDDGAAAGTINITVTGLPSGLSPDIVLIDETDTETNITGDVSLSDLPSGTYILEVNYVEEAGTRYIGAEEEITIVVTGGSSEDVAIEYGEFSSINGIVGTWVSAGDDVAALLVTYFAVDSIVATFSANQTYSVLQYSGGSTTPLELTGTFSQELSDVGSIWTITVEQSSPSTLVSEGIFEVDATASVNAMQYEIVQTSPDIGATVPTPAAGFGADAVLGSTNTQVYKRRSF